MILLDRPARIVYHLCLEAFELASEFIVVASELLNAPVVEDRQCTLGVVNAPRWGRDKRT